MRLTLVAAACLAGLSAASPATEAAVIGGTYSVSVTAWAPGSAVPPPLPADAAATFRFDNSQSISNALLSGAAFTADFAVTRAVFFYTQPTDTISLAFVTGGAALLGVFDHVSTAPVAETPTFITPTTTVAAEAFTAGFTPTNAIPEPSALVLLTSGIIGLGLLRRRN